MPSGRGQTRIAWRKGRERGHRPSNHWWRIDRATTIELQGSKIMQYLSAVLMMESDSWPVQVVDVASIEVLTQSAVLSF